MYMQTMSVISDIQAASTALLSVLGKSSVLATYLKDRVTSQEDPHRSGEGAS